MRAVMLSLVFATAVAAACSATPTVNFGTGSSGAGAGDSGAGAGTSGAGAGSSGSHASGAGGGLMGLGGFSSGNGASSGTGAAGCSAAAELVYVFDTDNNIHSFDPPSKTFTQIANASCASSPNSMAIDRNLVAWLNFIGSIYTFDLKTNGPCKLAIDLTQYPGFEQVGMGFATDAVGGTAETLYIDSVGGGAGGLARINMTTMAVVPIGAFGGDQNLLGQSAELTGTGDARLFGYFTTDPFVRVAQINKSNADIVSDNALDGFTPPSDWAFSFWGGDFYLYAFPVSVNNSSNSSVVHYSPATQAVDLSYVPDVGFTIIGAGVSTCAPLTPPA